MTFDQKNLTINAGGGPLDFLKDLAVFSIHMLRDCAIRPDAPADVVRDWDVLAAWFDVDDTTDFTPAQTRAIGDTWLRYQKSLNGRGFPAGDPTPAAVYEAFSRLSDPNATSPDAMLETTAPAVCLPIAKTAPPVARGVASDPQLTPEIRGVFDRMTANMDPQALKAARRAAQKQAPGARLQGWPLKLALIILAGTLVWFFMLRQA